MKQNICWRVANVSVETQALCILIHALIKQNKVLIHFGYCVTEERNIMLRNFEISSPKLIKIHLTMFDDL
jgi:hypothetical protein